MKIFLSIGAILCIYLGILTMFFPKKLEDISNKLNRVIFNVEGAVGSWLRVVISVGIIWVGIMLFYLVFKI